MALPPLFPKQITFHSANLGLYFKIQFTPLTQCNRKCKTFFQPFKKKNKNKKKPLSMQKKRALYFVRSMTLHANHFYGRRSRREHVLSSCWGYNCCCRSSTNPPSHSLPPPPLHIALGLFSRHSFFCPVRIC